MSFIFTIDSTSDRDLELQLSRRAEEIRNLPLSQLDLDAVPLHPPADPEHPRRNWSRTNYITGTYYSTGWLLRSEQVPFRETLRKYAQLRDSRPDHALAAYPVMSEWHPRIRKWIISGRIPEQDLDRFLLAYGWVPMMLLDRRGWWGPPPITRMEQTMRELEDLELAELLDRFQDYEYDGGPASWPAWKKKQMANQQAMDRVRNDNIRVGKDGLLAAADRDDSAEDQQIVMLIGGLQPRGAWETHKNGRADRIVRQMIKAQEVLAWSRLQAIMLKTGEQ